MQRRLPEAPATPPRLANGPSGEADRTATSTLEPLSVLEVPSQRTLTGAV
ncbi:MAG: hypothetical protein ACLQG3_14035 [Terracidiphilus sp.]